jgi:hypothetical protein
VIARDRLYAMKDAGAVYIKNAASNLRDARFDIVEVFVDSNKVHGNGDKAADFDALARAIRFLDNSVFDAAMGIDASPQDRQKNLASLLNRGRTERKRSSA